MVSRPSASSLVNPLSSSAARSASVASERSVSPGSLPCLLAPTPAIAALTDSATRLPFSTSVSGEPGCAVLAEGRPPLAPVLGGGKQRPQRPLQLQAGRQLSLARGRQAALGGEQRQRRVAGD